MNNKIKSISFALLGLLLLASVGCKKGTFDINNPNPNSPSPESVPTKFILSAALNGSAGLIAGGNNDFANYYMGYWAVSGDYIPNANLLTYNITATFYTGNWDGGYPLLKNYGTIIGKSEDASQANYAAIANIMSSLHFQNLVDIYNNIPYSQALLGAVTTNPSYDDAATVYASLVDRLDAAIASINANPDAEDPGAYDIMFGGDMTMWKKLANTIKLRILMRQAPGAASYIQSKLSGLTSDDFLGAGEDAQINPGYGNTAGNKQSPLWQDIGFGTSGTSYGNRDYNRACKYATDFYNNLADPRASLIYSENSSGAIQGRNFGSTESGNEHNTDISAPGGPGILTDPGMAATIMMASESYFLQAEAAQRGYLGGEGEAESLYLQAVTESFRFLGVEDYANAAVEYTSQSSVKTNWEFATDKIALIITQKWAAMNTIDPLESWADWRRLGIPSDLPTSVYPGTTASKPPIRLVYPQSEYDYNNANVSSQGSINPLSSKIFWMP